jgi:hypothetical protein
VEKTRVGGAYVHFLNTKIMFSYFTSTPSSSDVEGVTHPWRLLAGVIFWEFIEKSIWEVIYGLQGEQHCGGYGLQDKGGYTEAWERLLVCEERTHESYRQSKPWDPESGDHLSRKIGQRKKMGSSEGMVAIVQIRWWRLTEEVRTDQVWDVFEVFTFCSISVCHQEPCPICWTYSSFNFHSLFLFFSLRIFTLLSGAQELYSFPLKLLLIYQDFAYVSSSLLSLSFKRGVLCVPPLSLQPLTQRPMFTVFSLISFYFPTSVHDTWSLWLISYNSRHLR